MCFLISMAGSNNNRHLRSPFVWLAFVVCPATFVDGRLDCKINGSWAAYACIDTEVWCSKVFEQCSRKINLKQCTKCNKFISRMDFSAMLRIFFFFFVGRPCGPSTYTNTHSAKTNFNEIGFLLFVGRRRRDRFVWEVNFVRWKEHKSNGINNNANCRLPNFGCCGFAHT